jgi:hypothetical protein
VIQEHAKKWLKVLGKANLGNCVDDWKHSEKDNFFSVKSGEAGGCFLFKKR